MNRYLVECYKKSLLWPKRIPFGPFKFNVQAKSIEQAALIVAEQVDRVGEMSMYNCAWNATVIGPKNKKYEILREGAWLINLKTGKRISDLEKRVARVH